MTSRGHRSLASYLRHWAPSQRAALVEASCDLEHDLGRYVFFQLSAVAPGADPAELARAARADVLHTLTNGQESVSAAQVWRSALVKFQTCFEAEDGSFDAFLREPVVRGLHEDMNRLLADSAALANGTWDLVCLHRVVQTAQRVSEGTRRLHDTLRELADEVM